ncbi:cobalamin B12-binding domain-containing protein [Paracoccaceae bacterium Fryx2]|nr:cobalamin B12-binding domain-containing protein [Paracoccaceae bacterium Fryx2]
MENLALSDPARRNPAEPVPSAAADGPSGQRAAPPLPRHPKSPAAVTRHIRQLHQAATADDHDSCGDAAMRMQKAGVDAVTIAENLVPAAARLIGIDWVEDRMSFADVTIACARLQGLLRHLDLDWRAGVLTRADAPSILLAVARNAQHTLGAMVLLDRLRRAGFSVRLLLGAGPGELQMALRQTPVQAVMLSASLGDSVPMLRRLVETVRKTSGARVPVVIGGTLLDAEPALAARTGADVVTSDLDAALERCGLTAQPVAQVG